MSEHLPVTGVANALAAPGVKGDGIHDDAAGLQAVLDSGAEVVYLPPPPGHYLIGKTLRVHSGQTLQLDRHTVVRLKDHADQIMVANADPERGNADITLSGGVWDMNNLNQTPHPPWRGTTYAPERYVGVLMRFNNVRNLCLRGLTLKDPESFGMQLGNLRQFTIEDITFDYNLRRPNMDGVHLHGNCRWGRIANLKGTTNDDLVALNADDGGMYEMTRGPIEDIAVDGIYSEDGYTAVRLLSAGSPVRRIRLSNIFGTYRYNVVSFTNHQVHPGTASSFDDIVINGVFCSKSIRGRQHTEPVATLFSPIWIDAPAVVGSLTLSDYHRSEHTLATPDIAIEAGATVRHLSLNYCTVVNETAGGITTLLNRGKIETLSMTDLYARAEGTPPRGHLLENTGMIGAEHRNGVFPTNLAADSGAPMSKESK